MFVVRSSSGIYKILCQQFAGAAVTVMAIAALTRLRGGLSFLQNRDAYVLE